MTAPIAFDPVVMKDWPGFVRADVLGVIRDAALEPILQRLLLPPDLLADIAATDPDPVVVTEIGDLVGGQWRVERIALHAS